MSRQDRDDRTGRRGEVATDHQRRVLNAVAGFYEGQDTRTPAQGRTAGRSTSRDDVAQRSEHPQEQPNPDDHPPA
ncbi:MAG: hypothetical protein KBI32_10245 [Phycisphaerae bacterium]|nr:hypothetical protein [Phycisphaerae bacterium]